MRHLVLVTTLDVAGRDNNREHHLIRVLGARFETVTVIYRRRGRATHALRDFLVPQITRRDDGRVSWIAVNPPLNVPEGAVRDRFGSGARQGRLRRLVGRLADVVAIGKDIATILMLARALRRHLPGDSGVACEALGPWAAAAAERVRRSGRLARYAYVDRDYEPGFLSSALRRAWAAGMEARAARRADLTLSIGQRLAALRRATAGVEPVVVPTGVDTRLFAPRARTVPEPVLIFTGNVAAWSGVEESLGALALLAPDHPRLRLQVFGSILPAYAAHLRAEAARLGIADRVEWHGAVPHHAMAAALDAAGIGLSVFRRVPLRVYACPLKLLEYMAAGLPVVALADSEAGDITLRAGCGLVADPAPAAIAAAIRTLLANPAAYAAMSQAGIAAAAAMDWQVLMATEHAALARMCGGAA